jgi:proton glutamate symport protein
MSKTLIIFLALVGGLLIGIAVSGATQAIAIADVIGALWLNALRMTVIPLVVALLVTGIVQTAAAARAGRLAARAVIMMMVILWCSSIMAAVMMPVLLSLFPMPAGSGEALRAALAEVPAQEGGIPPIGDFLRAMIPTNPIAAAANDAILPLIVFTTAFAFAVTRLEPVKRASIGGFFEAIADAMVIIINWVLALAPFGVFALAFVVGAKAGAEAFGAV